MVDSIKNLFLSQLIQQQQNYFYPTVQECFQKHRGQLWWLKIAF